MSPLDHAATIDTWNVVWSKFHSDIVQICLTTDETRILNERKISGKMLVVKNKLNET